MILFHTSINNKNMGKTVCKMQCLKMAFNSIHQVAQYVQLTLFPPTYFDLIIDGGVGVKFPHHAFTWIENCY